MKKFHALLLALPLLLANNGDCSGQAGAESKDTAATNRLLDDANARVGMPRVTNFTEKRLANMIVELRDQPNLATYSYVMDMQGRAHCLGHSIGYGLPYTTQITNPMKVTNGYLDANTGSGNVTIPQAEPNGLYSSDSTKATWLLLVGKNGSPQPAYVESDVIVTLAPLRNAADPC